MAKELVIEGILFPIKVRIVTLKYLTRITGNAGERVLGAYISQDNLIYLAKEQSKEALVHALLHELYHAFVDQANQGNMGEEASADAFASLLIRLFKPGDLNEILSNRD